MRDPSDFDVESLVGSLCCCSKMVTETVAFTGSYFVRSTHLEVFSIADCIVAIRACSLGPLQWHLLVEL